MSDACSVEALEVTRAGLKIMEPIPGQVSSPSVLFSASWLTWKDQVMVNEEIRLIFQGQEEKEDVVVVLTSSSFRISGLEPIFALVHLLEQ